MQIVTFPNDATRFLVRGVRSNGGTESKNQQQSSSPPAGSTSRVQFEARTKSVRSRDTMVLIVRQFCAPRASKSTSPPISPSRAASSPSSTNVVSNGGSESSMQTTEVKTAATAKGSSDRGNHYSGLRGVSTSFDDIFDLDDVAGRNNSSKKW